ncbi:hypothetical protein DYH09_02155 [bacterium CPR1]|nr:hypothetical protein [bacterium CPR1]
MPQCDDLTQEQILDMMQDYVDSMRRVQDLKDQLLYSNFFGNDEEMDRLHDECHFYDQTMSEIHSIYSQKVLPLMDRVASFLGRYPDEVAELAEAES